MNEDEAARVATFFQVRGKLGKQLAELSGLSLSLLRVWRLVIPISGLERK
jgi:hypothetical protein